MFERYRLFPWLIVSALAAQGCGGPDIDAICQEREQCLAGNEADIEACVVSFEGVSDLASDIGCGDEFDAYWICQETQASCRDLPTGQNCMADADCDVDDNERCTAGQCVAKYYGFDPQATSNPCEAEENAYQRCF